MEVIEIVEKWDIFQIVVEAIKGCTMYEPQEAKEL